MNLISLEAHQIRATTFYLGLVSYGMDNDANLSEDGLEGIFGGHVEDDVLVAGQLNAVQLSKGHVTLVDVVDSLGNDVQLDDLGVDRSMDVLDTRQT